MIRKQVCLVAVVLGALLGVPQVAAAQAPDERAAAREFSYAAYRLRVAVKERLPEIQRAASITRAPACRSALSGGTPAQQREHVRRSRRRLVDLLAGAMFAPVSEQLRTFQAELDRVPTADPALRSGRAAWRESIALYLQVRPLPSDLCAQLGRWRTAGYAAAARPGAAAGRRSAASSTARDRGRQAAHRRRADGRARREPGPGASLRRRHGLRWLLARGSAGIGLVTRVLASLLALLTIGVLALPQAASAQAPDDRAAAREFSYAAYRLRVKIKAAVPAMNQAAGVLTSRCLQRREQRDARADEGRRAQGGRPARRGAVRCDPQPRSRATSGRSRPSWTACRPPTRRSPPGGSPGGRRSSSSSRSSRCPPTSAPASAPWVDSGYADAALPVLQPAPLHELLASSQDSDAPTPCESGLRRAAARMVRARRPEGTGTALRGRDALPRRGRARLRMFAPAT